MSGDNEDIPSKKLKLANGHEEGMHHVDGEEEVESNQEFIIRAETSPGYSGGEDMEEEEYEEMEEEYEAEEEDEEPVDSSNAQNIFEVKAFTDLIFPDGNFKEGDDLKNSIDFSETCVQQMFGKDILNEDQDEGGSHHSGEEASKPQENGTHMSSTDDTEEAHIEKDAEEAEPVTPRGRGRPRKRKKTATPSSKAGRGEGKKKRQEDEVDFPAEYLLSTGIPEADIEELKLGYTVLQDIMYQPCSGIFQVEPQFSEVADKIEYDLLVEKPMWFALVEQNLCKGAYRTLSDLMCDIRLIVENCYKFWKLRDDDMLRSAFKLEDCLLQRLVLLPEDVQKKVSWDLDAEAKRADTNGSDASSEKNFTVQDIRNKSKLFRLVESSASQTQPTNSISKESLEADIVDFENNTVFADGNTIIETVNSMWELADIGHFLSLTHSLLRVPQPTQLEVERMFLVPQSSLVLARLMTSLLVRPISRAKLERGPPMPYGVWKSRLQAKVSEWYKAYHAKQGDDLEVFESIGIDPMFWNILGPDYNPLESHEYHQLHYFQRVWLFKGLCSYVLHNHKTMIDCFNSLPLSSARLPPLGNDRQGNAYFFYPDFIDVRLYRQNMPRGAPTISTAQPPHWVGNYLLLPLQQQQAELTAHRASLSTNPRTPYNPPQVPLEERELFFPKQKFLPSRRKDNLVILANSVEGLEILLGEMKSERQDTKFLQSLEEVYKTLKKRENNIDYVTYKARCSMFTEYNEFMKRPDNYEDPDLNYWTFKMNNLSEDREEDVTSFYDDYGDATKTNGEIVDDNTEDGGVRRSRREVHHVYSHAPDLSDLDSDQESGSDRGDGGGDFDKDGGSSDEWAPGESKKNTKKKLLFSKPPAQTQDDMILPASPTPDELEHNGLELGTMTLTPQGLHTPDSSPAKPDQMDPLNITSLKCEIVDGIYKEVTLPSQLSPAGSFINVKSSGSLVGETSLPTNEDPLNIASLKRELVDGAHSLKREQVDGAHSLERELVDGDHSLERELVDGDHSQEPTAPSQPLPSRPVIKVKSNISLVREDLGQEGLNLQTMPSEPIIMSPQVPLMSPTEQPQVDPLATKVLVKTEEIDDDIEVLEEKVLKPSKQQLPSSGNLILPPGTGPGENSIVKIGNLVYQIKPGPGGPPLAPGTMIRMPANLLPPGMHSMVRATTDPSQQLVIQNPRTLNPAAQMTARGGLMRGRPLITGPRIHRGPGPPQGSPRGMTVMRGSPRGYSPRGRGMLPLNITPRKVTPPPIPRQLMNRNISVSLVEPKPKPALPKLAGVTITPSKQKPSPAKTLIFNSTMSPKSSTISPAPAAQKTQMVDANVQLQWGADGSTSYVIELANNQTQALTREQVQFFKNKNNGMMPNVVRIAVPIDVARRVKPPCITL